MDCSMLCSPVLHYLLKFAQIHIHWFSDAITISSSVVLFTACSQSFPALRSFPMSQLFASGGQSTGVSASTSVLPMNIQGWFSLGLTGLISLLSKGLSRVFSSTTVSKHEFFGIQPSFCSNSHVSTWLLEETIALTLQTFVRKVMSLLSNMLSRFIITLLSRSMCLWISLLKSPSSVILEPKKITCHCFHFSPCYFQIKCLYSISFHWFILLVKISC